MRHWHCDISARGKAWVNFPGEGRWVIENSLIQLVEAAYEEYRLERFAGMVADVFIKRLKGMLR